MIGEILFPALAIGAIALFFGALLAFASIVFKVDNDGRIDEIGEILPGANCGGCGYAGCSAFAKAIVEEGADIGRCNLMTEEKLNAIASIMGVEAKLGVKKAARVACNGTCDKAPDKYDVYGIDNCIDAVSLANGPKKCEYGCMGLGSCISVCTNNAISIVDGIAYVDEEKCGGCGACANICPKGVIKMVVKGSAFVSCNSKDKGAVVNKACSAGCIGCRICEKKCEAGAIKVVDNLAVVDSEKCTACGECAAACPKKVIEII